MRSPPGSTSTSTRPYSYSDSFTDLPMLEAVGHPVAVNPDRPLARVARERAWETATFAEPVRLRDRIPGTSGDRPPVSPPAWSHSASAPTSGGGSRADAGSRRHPLPRMPNVARLAERFVKPR